MYRGNIQQDNQGLCVAEGQDPTDNTAELDPDRDCNYFTDSYAIQKFEAISSCKDNCKGGKLKTRLSVI